MNNKKISLIAGTGYNFLTLQSEPRIIISIPWENRDRYNRVYLNYQEAIELRELLNNNLDNLINNNRLDHFPSSYFQGEEDLYDDNLDDSNEMII